MGIPTRYLPTPVTWIEPTTATDAYGNEVNVYDDGAGVALRVKIDALQTVEFVDGRDTFVTRWRMFTNEPGITGRARILWDGNHYEVDGEPDAPQTPAGFHHLEVTLRRAEG